MKFTVLIADDNVQWCNILQSSLKKHPVFEVLHPAHNGLQAIEVINTSKPDVVLLDLIMPVYDGLYIVNYIRKTSNYHPFIYVISGIGTNKTNSIMRNLDANYYSVKPIEAEAVVNNLLNLMTASGENAGNQVNNVTASRPAAPLAREEIDIDRIINEYLHELGAPLYRKSTRAIFLILKLALENESLLEKLMDLYKIVGEELSTSPASIERNTRTVIKNIQELQNNAYQHYFPDHKGKMTNTEFIHKSVYNIKLRIEDVLSDQISFS